VQIKINGLQIDKTESYKKLEKLARKTQRLYHTSWSQEQSKLSS